MTIVANPSHLEAVDPVVEGMARARQEQLGLHDSFGALPATIHGDAAFAGQGVVASVKPRQLPVTELVERALDLVINNQLGFTTAPESARSSVYPTDVAKTVQALIIHVNGDDPEDGAGGATRVRAPGQGIPQGRRDRPGRSPTIRHNQGDTTELPQPKMYAIIESLRSVRKLYTESLVCCATSRSKRPSRR